MLTVQEALVAIDRKADIALALLEGEQDVPPEVGEAVMQFARAASAAIDSLSDGNPQDLHQALGALAAAGARACRIAENHLIAGERGLVALQDAHELGARIAGEWTGGLA